MKNNMFYVSGPTGTCELVPETVKLHVQCNEGNDRSIYMQRLQPRFWQLHSHDLLSYIQCM